MGTLLSRTGEPATKSIVDVLTDDTRRVLVNTDIITQAPDGPFTWPTNLGINQARPLKGLLQYEPGVWCRALVDPHAPKVHYGLPKEMYFIDSGERIIRVRPSQIVFLDADKVDEHNKYTWKGTFQEALQAFIDTGYRIQ